MPSRVADIRDVLLLSAACVLGAIATPIAVFVGLPLFAAGAAGLVLRGRRGAAVAGAVIGAGSGAIIRPESLALAVPTLAGVIAMAILLPRWSYQALGFGLVAVVTVSGIAFDALNAAAEGTSLPELFARESASTLESVSKSLSASGAAKESIDQLGRLFVNLWPSAYVQLAIVTVVLTMAAVGWAASRSGRPGLVPPFFMVDLNVNVIWLPVAGLLLLAAGVIHSPEGVIFAVGMNVLLVARAVLLVQGLAVSGWLMKRTNMPSLARGIGYVVLGMADTFLPLVSLLGLIDVWANIRKLPRDGQTPEVAHGIEN